MSRAENDNKAPRLPSLTDEQKRDIAEHMSSPTAHLGMLASKLALAHIQGDELTPRGERGKLLPLTLAVLLECMGAKVAVLEDK